MITYSHHYAPKKVMEIDIGDICTHCGRDTSFGSGNGLFVNRISSGADGKLVMANTDVQIDVTINGWMCPECQMIECEKCGQMTDEYDSDFMCNECREKESNR
jgi:predicted RNA-binding Zn-ribbon protein involved in translation (DUF1610 family)